jgi:extradiol dioxygenase
MAAVCQLGYVGIGVSDVESWQALATDVLGLQAIPGEDESTLYLRMDSFHHRLELQSNGADDLEFVGWEVPDSATFERLARQLEAGGAEVTPGTQEEAERRGVLDVLRCFDPDGTRVEIFCGRPINQQPFHPTRPMSGFKTGKMGFGHILLYTRDLDRAVSFYRDLLGFRISDLDEVATPHGKVRLAFLHCNPRHHSIAFMETAAPPKRINHVMFECNSLDDVGSGRDLCLQRGIPVVIDLGRHMNDHMVSFYLANPSGFAIEYGWGARTIDDSSWQTERYTTVDSIWGHPQLPGLTSGAAAGSR